MYKHFVIPSLLVIVISGCTLSPIIPATPSLVSTSVAKAYVVASITPTLLARQPANCDAANLTNNPQITPTYENDRINQLRLNNLYVNRIDFSGDSTQLALNTSDGIYFVSIPDGKTRCFIPDEKPSNTGIAFSTDGSLFASVNRYGDIMLRNSVTGEIVRELHNSLYQSEVTWSWVEFNRDGSLLLTAGYAQPVRVWDITSGQVILETLGVHAAISQDGELLAVSGSDYIQIINIAHKSDPITKIADGTTPLILYLLFSKDGKYLYGLNAYSEISIWDVNTGELINTANTCPDCTGWGWEIEYPRITLSADGSRLLLVDPSEIILWNTQTWDKIMSENSANNSPIVDASISPDGKKIIVNYQDSSLIRFLYLD